MQAHAGRLRGPEPSSSTSTTSRCGDDAGVALGSGAAALRRQGLRPLPRARRPERPLRQPGRCSRGGREGRMPRDRPASRRRRARLQPEPRRLHRAFALCCSVRADWLRARLLRAPCSVPDRRVSRGSRARRAPTRTASSRPAPTAGPAASTRRRPRSTWRSCACRRRAARRSLSSPRRTRARRRAAN